MLHVSKSHHIHALLIHMKKARKALLIFLFVVYRLLCNTQGEAERLDPQSVGGGGGGGGSGRNSRRSRTPSFPSLPATNEEKLRLYRQHIAEDILTLKCPREGCHRAFLDFEGKINDVSTTMPSHPT